MKKKVQASRDLFVRLHKANSNACLEDVSLCQVLSFYFSEFEYVKLSISCGFFLLRGLDNIVVI